jgi:hypothetical protein
MDLIPQNRTQGKTRGESRRALVVSVVAHVVLGAGLIQVLLMPGPVRNWLWHPGETRPKEEHLRYIAIPSAESQPERGRPSASPPPPPPAGAPAPAPAIVAPTAVPSTIPVAPAKPNPPVELEGTGPVTATGGPASGARPEYHDPKVWVSGAAPDGQGRPRTVAAQLDSAAHAIIRHVNDSLAMGGPQRQPGDWTIPGKNGQKWGVDQKFIHLGPVEIPTAILAVLPLNITNNPIAANNERLLNSRHDDINFQANRAHNEEDFNKAVKEERLRKEREHEQQAKDHKDQQPTDQSASPTVAKTGSQ